MLIRLFGTTTVVGGGGDRPAPSSSSIQGVKPRQLLGILATSLGEPLAKERLADTLWDGNPPRSYVASLESYICVLRRHLGVSAGRAGALATTSRGYVLDPEAVRVDLVEFGRLVRTSAAADPALVVRNTTRALALVQGQLLAAEGYAPWAQAARHDFDRLLVEACTRAAMAAALVGDHSLAVELADRAIGVDPLAEPARLARIRALTALGRRTDALREYADLRAAVVDALGLEPSTQARELYLDLLRGEAGSSSPQSGRVELSALLGLLRQALEAVPGIVVPPEDRRLSALAVDLLGAA